MNRIFRLKVDACGDACGRQRASTFSCHAPKRPCPTCCHICGHGAFCDGSGKRRSPISLCGNEYRFGQARLELATPSPPDLYANHLRYCPIPPCSRPVEISTRLPSMSMRTGRLYPPDSFRNRRQLSAGPRPLDAEFPSSRPVFFNSSRKSHPPAADRCRVL